jgi:hypothetical protein
MPSVTRKSFARAAFEHRATVRLADVNTDLGSFTGKAMDLVLSTASRPALLSSQPPVQCVSLAIYCGIKRPERDANHFPPSSDGIKNALTPFYLRALKRWFLVTGSLDTGATCILYLYYNYCCCYCQIMACRS